MAKANTAMATSSSTRLKPSGIPSASLRGCRIASPHVTRTDLRIRLLQGIIDDGRPSKEEALISWARGRRKEWSAAHSLSDGIPRNSNLSIRRKCATLGLMPYGSAGARAATCWGYGGQFLFVVPEHDLVAVFNGWNIYDKPELEPK